MTLFSRRYVINLDPLTTPRGAAVDHQVRSGHRAGGTHLLPATGTAGKARWQRQQTTYQLTARTLRTARTDVSAGARLTTRRERTLTADENFLSANGKKLLMDVGSSRNGETCRVIELKLNGTANTAQTLHGSETSRKQHQQQRTTAGNAATGAAGLLLPYTPADCFDHHANTGGGIGVTSAGAGAGVILPQLATHR